MEEATSTKPPPATTPVSCAMRSLAPPPKRRPLPVVFGLTQSSAKRPTKIVPRIPQTRWTEVAPTGSSTPTLSKQITAGTTTAPAMSPMIAALDTLTNAQGAVTATKPAKQPLIVMPKSGFLRRNVDIAVAARRPVQAAMLVVRQICAIRRGSAAIVLPGLNPNHPSQSTMAPISASDILCPGIALIRPLGPNFPKRGPRIMAPVRAAQPPTECTTVDPAKSQKPDFASQPPPQIQCPMVG